MIPERKLVKDESIRGYRCNACDWKRSQLAPEAWDVHPRTAFDVHRCVDFPLSPKQQLARYPDWERDEYERGRVNLEESLKHKYSQIRL
jgi:hypothetical protein